MGDSVSRGDLVASVAFEFVGCSLVSRREELAKLVACGIDNPSQVVQIKSNCAMFARGVMRRCGVIHPILEAKYRIGRAVSDVLEIARQFEAIEEFEGQYIKKGTILHYATAGKNDDHIECCTQQDASDTLGWVVRHCGGGRPNNAITELTSDIRTNAGRPLIHVIDPDLLLGA